MKKNGHAKPKPTTTIEKEDLRQMETLRLKLENTQLKILALQQEGRAFQEQNTQLLQMIQRKYDIADGDTYDSATGVITKQSASRSTLASTPEPEKKPELPARS